MVSPASNNIPQFQVSPSPIYIRGTQESANLKDFDRSSENLEPSLLGRVTINNLPKPVKVGYNKYKEYYQKTEQEKSDLEELFK